MHRLLLCILAIIISASAVLTIKGQEPQIAPKQLPKFEVPSFCPPEGSPSVTGDEELNKRKNRVDESSKYDFIGIETLKQLQWPRTVSNKKRADWTVEEAKAVSRYEGIPIVVQGYLVQMPSKHGVEGTEPQGPESCNCGRSELNYVDFSLWLADVPDGVKANSLVAKITPRVRKRHVQWTIQNLGYIARERLVVRVYGWLLLDQFQGAEVGRTKSTVWEIHPITQIEVMQGRKWKTL